MKLYDEMRQRGTFRLSDFPRRRGWVFVVNLFKTIEVLLFKLLQWLDLYRPQKSIVGIPSLATRHFTLLQALVYNGTQEEVLGYRPRRLLHRVLRGLPDLELLEKVQFQLAVSPNQIRSIEASTEIRGFVQLQVPWALPWKSSDKAWLRIQPLGVQTLLGTFTLGDYEILSSPVFFLNESVKWIIVSDIDDTIKDTRIAETVGFRQILSGLFRGHYYTYEPIEGMPELYQDLAKQGAMIIYLTSTPYQLAPFLLKFLKQAKFPEGPLFLRWLGYGRFGHKWRALFKILSNLDHQKVILIGDSGEQDLQIYRRVCDNPAFNNHVERILIRHVPGTPIQKSLQDKEQFYNTMEELKTQILAAMNVKAETP